MKAGDRILFGGYRWIVLERCDEKALLLTEDIVELRDYHSKSTTVTWKDSELRGYLNGDFFDRFCEVERSRILQTQHDNPGNLWYQVDGGEDTIDRVFILSINDVVRTYFGDSSRLLDFPGNHQRYWFQRKDENNAKRKACYLESPWWWWIRTPGKHQRVAAYVHGDGNIGIQGNGVSKRNTNVVHPLANDTRGGIRPALWIRVEEQPCEQV